MTNATENDADAFSAETDHRSIHLGQAWCHGCRDWRPEAGAVDGLCAPCAAEPDPANLTDVLDAIEAIDGGAWVGDTAAARILIAALIDQAGYPLGTQGIVARLLGLSRVKGAR